MKTIIFTQRVEVSESSGERRDCADQRVSEFLRACGYASLALPNHAEMAKEIVGAVRPSGIVLTGGNSLVKYGGNAPERDATDEAYIQLAIEKGIPLYGFCRGMQSILDHFGESLVDVRGHAAVRMTVRGDDDPKYGGFTREVNSYHNQGCTGISTPDLHILARSGDGVVKAIRHACLPILATMWHPERESTFTPEDINMIRQLFQ